MNNLIIRCRLFGIPTSIHPSVFLILLLLGSGMSASGSVDVSVMLFFVVSGLLCLISHELGHALTAKLGYGAHPQISIAWLGGVTETDQAPPTRALALMMTLAGPLATLLPGLVCILLLGAQIGSVGTALGWTAYQVLPFDWGAPLLESLGDLEAALRIEEQNRALLLFYLITNMIGLFWCVLNLVPALPLDGGHVCAMLSRSLLTAARVGVVSGAVAAVLLGWYTQSVWNLLLFGWLAYYNYKLMRHFSGR